MPDLSAPVRVTWELPGDPSLAAAQWRHLAEARVLLVEAQVSGRSLGGLPGLAAGLASAGGPRLSLLGRPDPLLAALEALGPRGLAQAEIRVLEPFRPEASVEELAAATHRLVPCLWSDPESLPALEQALELAAAYRLGAVGVLNPPAPAVPLAPEDRSRAADLWLRRAPPGLEARIHDVFLARAMGLDTSAHGGCQGASALCHVEPDGRVTACRTLPVELGSLRDASLKEIWASASRRAVAGELSAVPAECTGCAVAEICRGGCPGLARGRGRDASCPGPVSPEGASAP